MKTTIKLDAHRAIVVQPQAGGAVSISFIVGAVPTLSRTLTPDQCGVLLFGLEQAAEASEVRRARVTA